MAAETTMSAQEAHIRERHRYWSSLTGEIVDSYVSVLRHVSTGLYSDGGRVVFELLQNCEDASYSDLGDGGASPCT